LINFQIPLQKEFPVQLSNCQLLKQDSVLVVYKPYIMASPQVSKDFFAPSSFFCVCIKNNFSVFHFKNQHIVGFYQLIIVIKINYSYQNFMNVVSLVRLITLQFPVILKESLMQG
jgi:hypothetical protein